MRKNITRILAVLLMLAMLIPFAACGSSDDNTNENENNSSVYHTITFNTNGGSTVRNMTVKHGTFASAPAAPVKDNYIFLRWQTENGRIFFFDLYMVEEDMNLTAIWIQAEKFFDLAPMPDNDGIMITDINYHEDFDTLHVPKIINGKTVKGLGENAFEGVQPSHASVIVFPDTVTYIEKGALSAINEVSIVLPGVITYLEESAFAANATLSKITLGEGMTTIPMDAFYSCTALTSIDIPKGVTLIEEGAFEKASSLVTAVIPSTVKTIEHSAFNDCSALKTVFFGGTEAEFDNVDIDLGNDPLTEAKIYFYSEAEPTAEGNFWHYNKNGSPTTW